MGSLAAGSAAAMGTGAFTSASMTRSATMTVAKDKNAYIGLRPGGARGASERVHSSDGELAIDFTNEGDADGSGINDNSKYQIGAMDDSVGGDKIDFDSLYDSNTNPAAKEPGAPVVMENGKVDENQSAFIIDNQSGQTLDLEIGLNSSSDNSGAVVYLQGRATDIDAEEHSYYDTADGATATKVGTFDLDDPTQGAGDATNALSFNNGNSPSEAIPPGESVYVSLQVDTTVDDSSNISLGEELVINANEAADPSDPSE